MKAKAQDPEISTGGWRKALFGQQAAYLLIILAAVGLIYLFGLREMRFFRIPSASMTPTLLKQDYIVTLNEAHYSHGDIVVLQEEDGSGYFVKRIVGLPGDWLMVRQGTLYRNDLAVNESYLAEPMQYAFRNPVEVEAGRVFVLGDNRNESLDSAWTGKSYAIQDIIGKVRFIYYPYTRFGALPEPPGA